jgi:hypothetical protein
MLFNNLLDSVDLNGADDRKRKYPVHMSMIDQLHQEVFQYYGTHGQVIN